MRALRDAYSTTNQIDSKSLYLFMFAGGDTENKLQGDMPLKSQFGYIFNVKESTESTARTIAHELGHGFFELRHTFSKKYNVKQGTTDNLMDYNNGKELVKYQWDVLHDPKKRLFDWAQSEEEGQSLPTYDNYIKDRIAVERILAQIRKSVRTNKGDTLRIEGYIMYSDTVMICKQNIGRIYIGVSKHRSGVRIINNQSEKLPHIYSIYDDKSKEYKKYKRIEYWQDGDSNEHDKTVRIDYPAQYESIILNYLSGGECNNVIKKTWNENINKTIMLINSATVSEDIDKHKKKQSISYFSDNWDRWHTTWENSNKYKYISHLKIEYDDLPNWLKEKRYINEKGNFNGIPDTVIQVIRPDLLRQRGMGL